MWSRQTSCVSPKYRWAGLPRRCHRFDQFTGQITWHEGRPLSAQDQTQIPRRIAYLIVTDGGEPYAVLKHRGRLDKLWEGNAAYRHAPAVEAIRFPPEETMSLHPLACPSSC